MVSYDGVMDVHGLRVAHVVTFAYGSDLQHSLQVVLVLPLSPAVVRQQLQMQMSCTQTGIVTVLLPCCVIAVTVPKTGSKWLRQLPRQTCSWLHASRFLGCIAAGYMPL